ncbi:MAG: hypothetical protein IAI48_15890 [Candidatus Eremiobacteraeota bacterium]|nr:hypothetical protein [Candidatus Eremiobacteraeota bacterium]
MLSSDPTSVIRSTAPPISPDEQSRYGHGTKSYAFEFALPDPRDKNVLIHAFTGDFAAIPDTPFGHWLVARRVAEFDDRIAHPDVEREGLILDADQQRVVRPCTVLSSARIACANMSDAPYRLIGITDFVLPEDASVYGDPSKPVVSYRRIRLRTFAVSSPISPNAQFSWYYGSNWKVPPQ